MRRRTRRNPPSSSAVSSAIFQTIVKMLKVPVEVLYSIKQRNSWIPATKTPMTFEDEMAELEALNEDFLRTNPGLFVQSMEGKGDTEMEKYVASLFFQDFVVEPFPSVAKIAKSLGEILVSDRVWSKTEGPPKKVKKDLQQDFTDIVNDWIDDNPNFRTRGVEQLRTLYDVDFFAQARAFLGASRAPKTALKGLISIISTGGNYRSALNQYRGAAGDAPLGQMVWAFFDSQGGKWPTQEEIDAAQARFDAEKEAKKATKKATKTKRSTARSAPSQLPLTEVPGGLPTGAAALLARMSGEALPELDRDPMVGIPEPEVEGRRLDVYSAATKERRRRRGLRKGADPACVDPPGKRNYQLQMMRHYDGSGGKLIRSVRNKYRRDVLVVELDTWPSKYEWTDSEGESFTPYAVLYKAGRPTFYPDYGCVQEGIKAWFAEPKHRARRQNTSVLQMTLSEIGSGESYLAYRGGGAPSPELVEQDIFDRTSPLPINKQIAQKTLNLLTTEQRALTPGTGQKPKRKPPVVLLIGPSIESMRRAGISDFQTRNRLRQQHINKFLTKMKYPAGTRFIGLGDPGLTEEFAFSIQEAKKAGKDYDLVNYLVEGQKEGPMKKGFNFAVARKIPAKLRQKYPGLTDDQYLRAIRDQKAIKDADYVVAFWAPEMEDRRLESIMGKAIDSGKLGRVRLDYSKDHSNTQGGSELSLDEMKSVFVDGFVQLAKTETGQEPPSVRARKWLTLP
jgi:hypothetical protein